MSKKTSIISDGNHNPGISKEYQFMLSKDNDDYFRLVGNDSVIFIDLNNGYLGDKKESYYQIEIDKNSEFYTKFRSMMKDILEL